MKIVELNQSNTILNRYLAEIRDIHIQKDSLRFRRNIERIGEIMAYEISRDLPYHPLEVQTPLALATENVPAIQPVVATICVPAYHYIRDSSTISTRQRMPLFRHSANISTKTISTFISNTSPLLVLTEKH